jgi:hypothetical protein
VLDVHPPSGPNAAAPGATLMTDDPLQIALPDDVEQFLLIGQRERATNALMERRGITPDVARFLVMRWLFNQRRGATPSADNASPPEPIGC